MKLTYGNVKIVSGSVIKNGISVKLYFYKIIDFFVHCVKQYRYSKNKRAFKSFYKKNIFLPLCIAIFCLTLPGSLDLILNRGAFY